MTRFFSLHEAERALPEVEKAIREMLFLRAEHNRMDSELRQIPYRIMMAGGMQVNREQIGEMKEELKRTTERMQESYQQIQEAGAQVKDLDIGLIDFPSLYRGEEVCLCWKLGEGRIEYWHGVSEGFAGRKKIDQEFRENHRGDRPS